MAARALAPLARMAEATRGIDVAGLGRRIPFRGARDELDEVAHAFNETLARAGAGDRRDANPAQQSLTNADPTRRLRGQTELAPIST